MRRSVKDVKIRRTGTHWYLKFLLTSKDTYLLEVTGPLYLDVKSRNKTFGLWSFDFHVHNSLEFFRRA